MGAKACSDIEMTAELMSARSTFHPNSSGNKR